MTPYIKYQVQADFKDKYYNGPWRSKPFVTLGEAVQQAELDKSDPRVTDVKILRHTIEEVDPVRWYEELYQLGEVEEAEKEQ